MNAATVYQKLHHICQATTIVAEATEHRLSQDSHDITRSHALSHPYMMAPSAIEVLPETDTSTFTIPDRLTIQSVAKRRAASGKLLAGVAAAADVDSFKGRAQHDHKANAKRWDHRLTDESKARTGSSLKEAAKYITKPGMSPWLTIYLLRAYP